MELPWPGIAAVNRIAGANMVRKLAHQIAIIGCN
jgi:hypothetical protein